MLSNILPHSPQTPIVLKELLPATVNKMTQTTSKVAQNSLSKFTFFEKTSCHFFETVKKWSHYAPSGKIAAFIATICTIALATLGMMNKWRHAISKENTDQKAFDAMISNPQKFQVFQNLVCIKRIEGITEEIVENLLHQSGYENKSLFDTFEKLYLDDLKAAKEISDENSSTQAETTEKGYQIIPTSGSGLKCGYYALALGMMQRLKGVPQDKKDELFTKIGVPSENKEKLVADIESDNYSMDNECGQKILGNALHNYSIEHPELFSGEVDKMVTDMRAELLKTQLIGSKGTFDHYSEEELKVTVEAILKEQLEHTYITFDRLNILAQKFDFSTKLDEKPALDDKQTIGIHNPGGGHYSAVLLDSK